MKVHLAPTRARNILARIPADNRISASLTGGAINGQWADRDTSILHVTVQGDPNGIAARAVIAEAERAAYPNAKHLCVA